MNIDFNLQNTYVFYEEEIDKALEWLYATRDEAQNGWAWVQFIQPNEQNTAEVISTFVENIQWFEGKEDALDTIARSADYWLLDTSHAKISIDYSWVLIALQKIRTCEVLMKRLDAVRVQEAIDRCLQWLCDNSNIGNAAKGDGWGDNESEISSTIRTSLAIMGMNAECLYWAGREDASPERRALCEKYTDIVDKAVTWLLSIQRHDGGWGHVDERMLDQAYERAHSFSFADLKYQSESNAACTGYVMIALSSDEKGLHTSELRRASQYLHASQQPSGGWNVFTEIGVRDGVRYTFRHFSTAWAVQGMIRSNVVDFRDEGVIHAFDYLTSLQDDNYGGWKSSPDADNYTWATCNALSTIRYLKGDLTQVHAKQFLNVVWDWWELRKKDANFHFGVKKTVFAFNGPMALLFCLTFSVMITLVLFFVYVNTQALAAALGETGERLFYSLITILTSVVLGLPWVVYVKNVFRSEMPGWIDSIGWVYGIIAGFVLVLYQFIL